VTGDETKTAAPSEPAAALPSGGTGRLRLYYEKNELKIAIAAFIGGFAVDILTVERIDSWFTIGQQVLYLTVITLALIQMFREQAGPAPAALEGMFIIRRWYYRYRNAILHFFLGTLLNLYAIFFFKSSSLLVSFSFLGVLVLLLLANETPRLKALGLPFKFALLSLCFLSFFALIVPTIIGSVGTGVFMLSILLGCVPLAGIAWLAGSRSPEFSRRARRQILVPLGLVLIGYLVSYLYKVTPPVPISIPFMGVYHFVERTDEGYRLSHERAMWQFWHNGDQRFFAQPGDKVYVYFRIFSPSRFSDQVVMRWYLKKEVTDRWQFQDQIPIKIVGGREQGFRGYGFKTHYQPGYWRVRVETTDGREIGRIHFTIATLPEAPRIFQVDIQ
jgi:DUF2914 family protein